jgi:hypothetical protein
MVRSLSGVRGGYVAGMIKHPRYTLFPVGTIVVIRPHITFPSYIFPQVRKHFNKFLSQETKIVGQFNKCCLVEIDNGAKGWGYDWMDPKKELIPDELFEI